MDKKRSRRNLSDCGRGSYLCYGCTYVLRCEKAPQILIVVVKHNFLAIGVDENKLQKEREADGKKEAFHFVIQNILGDVVVLDLSVVQIPHPRWITFSANGRAIAFLKLFVSTAPMTLQTSCSQERQQKKNFCMVLSPLETMWLPLRGIVVFALKLFGRPRKRLGESLIPYFVR